jgi:hypothetical protein
VCPDDASEAIDQFDVEVVPNSLLGKALVAQSIFDNKFLLGFAPEPPPFYLVPGDNRITVVWSQSPTETQGDPFFAPPAMRTTRCTIRTTASSTSRATASTAARRRPTCG